MKVSPAIFKTYDIRGLYPNDLNAESSLILGKAFGTYIQSKYGKRIVIGSDNRRSSESIRSAFIEGALSTGCHIVDVGDTLTPVIKFLTFKEEFDCGVMVTASHNPVDFNGFKFLSKRSTPIFSEELTKIKEICDAGNFVLSEGKYLKKESLVDEYKVYLKNNFTFNSKHLSVLIDCGHAGSAKIFPELLKYFGFECSTFLCNLDGNYPHGVPDPENRKFMGVLSKNVLYGKYDLGVAFDTDADRFGVVDEKGNFYEAEKLLKLYSESLILENPNAVVLYDVKSSISVEKHIKALGGTPKMLKVGSPYFLKEMKKGALLGGERSGHFYFSDKYFGYDDGIYSALRLLEILDSKNAKLSELVSMYPKTYHTDEVKLYMSTQKESFDLEDVAQSLLLHPKVLDIDTTDGLRVRLDEWSFFLLRNSNTGPYISSIFESDKKETLDTMFDIVKELIPAANLSNIEVHYS